MNEVMKNILTRRSTRKFTDEQIPKEVLRDIVDAALHAPSGMGKQTWTFTVITNRDVIARLAETMRAALGREHYDMYKPTALIIPSNLRESHLGRDDNSCALENIFLAAHSYGVGSVWINQLGAVCDDEKVRAMLDEFGIPSDHVVYGIAALGYAAPVAPYKDRTYAGEVRYIE